MGAISPFLLFSNFLGAASGDYFYGRRQQGKDNFFVVAHSRALVTRARVELHFLFYGAVARFFVE